MNPDSDINKKIRVNPRMILCRLCLREECFQVNIFGTDGMEKQVLQKIQSCFPIKISKNDNFSKSICYECLSSLNRTFVFIKKVLYVDRVMKRNYDEQHSSDTNLQNKNEVKNEKKVIPPTEQITTAENKPITAPHMKKSSKNKRHVSFDVAQIDDSTSKPTSVQQSKQQLAVKSDSHIFNQWKKHKPQPSKAKNMKSSSSSPEFGSPEFGSPKVNSVKNHTKLSRNLYNKHIIGNPALKSSKMNKDIQKKKITSSQQKNSPPTSSSLDQFDALLQKHDDTEVATNSSSDRSTTFEKPNIFGITKRVDPKRQELKASVPKSPAMAANVYDWSSGSSDVHLSPDPQSTMRRLQKQLNKGKE